MKRLLTLLLILFSLHSGAQSVFGYWYGSGNVKSGSSANNYLVELVLQPEKNYVKGLINYYFKNTYRSIEVKGNYNAATRQLSLYNIPVTYHGSISEMEVDCPMNIMATLRVSRSSSNLVGAFYAIPEYKNMCPDIKFDLLLNADISKKDSVLKAISEYKENYQVWKPAVEDTIVAVAVTPPPKKVINYVSEQQFNERESVVANEIEVESDSIRISMYDNGEIDGDIISIFHNRNLILHAQKLTHKSIRINLKLDTLSAVNELSMFAENLGLIPPNTALMVIEDGVNRFELRISSNMEKNATVRIKRKKTGVKVKSNN